MNIASIRCEDGVIATTANEIREVGRSFFFTLFSNDVSVSTLHTLTGFNKLDDETSLSLSIMPTKEEIHATLFAMNPFKVVGPNGFSAGFYQSQWSKVKAIFLDLCKDFFWVS